MLKINSVFSLRDTQMKFWSSDFHQILFWSESFKNAEMTFIWPPITLFCSYTTSACINLTSYILICFQASSTRSSNYFLFPVALQHCLGVCYSKLAPVSKSPGWNSSQPAGENSFPFACSQNERKELGGWEIKRRKRSDLQHILSPWTWSISVIFTLMNCCCWSRFF